MRSGAFCLHPLAVLLLQQFLLFDEGLSNPVSSSENCQQNGYYPQSLIVLLYLTDQAPNPNMHGACRTAIVRTVQKIKGLGACSHQRSALRNRCEEISRNIGLFPHARLITSDDYYCIFCPNDIFTYQERSSNSGKVKEKVRQKNKMALKKGLNQYSLYTKFGDSFLFR